MSDTSQIPPMPAEFLGRITSWPDAASQRFLDLRFLILQAAQGANAGPIAETLKWSEPAWRPIRPRQGSTLRVSWSANLPGQISLFVDCKTTLAETMQSVYPTVFTYEGNRALRLPLKPALPAQAIDHLARLTFTYHRKLPS